MSGRLRRWALVAALLAVAGASPRAYSHLSIESGGRVLPIAWQGTARWHARDLGVPGVTAGQMQQELAQAFATWENVPTASIAFQFGGFTSAAPFEDDDLSVFGFEHEPDMDRVLGATTFIVDVFTGEIIESDVFFNSAFPWSIAPGGEAGRFDFRSVAVHEIGHFIGLGHSAIGETEPVAGGRRVLGSAAVMFPISLGRGVVADRTLQPDDIAGASDLYPDGGFREETGIIAGRVVEGGAPIHGAHVVAFDPGCGNLVGGLSARDGRFRIAGLPPGAHVVRVEPLDDVDVDSFFDSPDIDVDFRVRFHPRLVAAPAGGAGPGIEITVQPK